MANIAPPPRIDYQVIHFSDRFPVVRTACGKLGPSAGRWGYVTCIPCLRAGPKDPRITKRIEELEAEERNDEKSSPNPEVERDAGHIPMRRSQVGMGCSQAQCEKGQFRVAR